MFRPRPPTSTGFAFLSARIIALGLDIAGLVIAIYKDRRFEHGWGFFYVATLWAALCDLSEIIPLVSGRYQLPRIRPVCLSLFEMIAFILILVAEIFTIMSQHPKGDDCGSFETKCVLPPGLKWMVVEAWVLGMLSILRFALLSLSLVDGCAWSKRHAGNIESSEMSEV